MTDIIKNGIPTILESKERNIYKERSINYKEGDGKGIPQQAWVWKG